MADATKWATWVARLQAVAQTGLTYSSDVYDLERYELLRQMAREAAAELAGGPPESVPGLFDGESGYATPKVDVRAAVFRGDALLFVRERSDGLWTLPGGWSEIGLTPSENVEKEVLEESGYVVKARKLVGVWDRRKHPHPSLAFHVYKLFFLCDLIGGESATSYETTEVGFFREDELPPLSSPRVVAEQIARVFAHGRDRDLPSEFH